MPGKVNKGVTNFIPATVPARRPACGLARQQHFFASDPPNGEAGKHWVCLGLYWGGFGIILGLIGFVWLYFGFVLAFYWL